jgi:processive 1,2-diacylglycerol beta-glucosyltransferase
VGAGHDGAANELADRLRRAGVVVDVRDYLQALPLVCRFILRDGYTISVGRVPAFFQWLFTYIEHSRLAARLLGVFCKIGHRPVLEWIHDGDFDVVVSTYPLASQSLGALRARRRIDIPVITDLTDPAPHRAWIHSDVDLHLTCTRQTAIQGAATYGVPMLVAGPLVPARFQTRLTAHQRAAKRSGLGLQQNMAVALLVCGSLGLGDIETSAGEVAAAGLTPLVLCGLNHDLLLRMRHQPGVVALGWRDDVHELMQCVDVLVHNAGGLTFTEALVAGLPAVSYRCIPGHGLANAATIEAAGLAPWVRTADELGDALRAQATRPRLSQELGNPEESILAVLAANVAQQSRRHAVA